MDFKCVCERLVGGIVREIEIIFGRRGWT